LSVHVSVFDWKVVETSFKPQYRILCNWLTNDGLVTNSINGKHFQWFSWGETPEFLCAMYVTYLP
jgi:hypothetical protein